AAGGPPSAAPPPVTSGSRGSSSSGASSVAWATTSGSRSSRSVRQPRSRSITHRRYPPARSGSGHEPQEGQQDDHGQRDGEDVPARPPVGALLERAGHVPSPGSATPSPARTQRISAATDSSMAPPESITAAVRKKQVSPKL